jgi:hydroxymethylpyrimidine/phosphomethylpyrimidine kinase
MWNINIKQIEKYCEKQVVIRGGHTQEGESKRKKLRTIWWTCSLYKNEYRILNQLKLPKESD